MLIFFSEGRGSPNLDKRLLRRLIDQFRDFFRTVVGWQPRQRLAQIHERRSIIRTPEKPDSPRLVAGWITLVASRLSNHQPLKPCPGDEGLAGTIEIFALCGRTILLSEFATR